MSTKGSSLPLTVVIPSHNGGELTLGCLQRVLPQLREGDTIVVVDNGSWDGTAEHITRVFPGLRVIVRRRALGFARACNVGASCGHTGMLLFLNQDVLLAPDALTQLREASYSYPNAIIGALLLAPEGTAVHHAGGVVLPNGLTEHLHRGTPRDQLPRRGIVECDYVTGAVFLISAQAFEALRGFDVRFSPAYYEELDLCIRARAKGIRSLVALEATGRHFEATVTGRDTPRFHFIYHRNRLRFVMKHYTREGLRRFVRAERRWLATPLSASVRESVARAYVALLVELPAWLACRRRQPPSFVPQEVAS